MYRNQLNAQLCAGVRSNKRDALDLAGKLPLTVKAVAMGIAPHELIIDPAQAGGLLGKFDAAVCRASGAAKEAVEVKGAGRASCSRAFKISRLRPGTPFELLPHHSWYRDVPVHHQRSFFCSRVRVIKKLTMMSH